MTDVVIHIGLHKTATRFLQRIVFANLDRSKFLVNPEQLVSTLRQALRHHTSMDAKELEACAVEALEQAGERTLLLSDPTISGDMYSSHADWQQNRDLVHRLFPGARIVYFVRNQSSWLQSAYRQQLAKGVAIPIEAFLNFREGDFRRRPARFVGGARTLNACDLRFLEIYEGYASLFGPENVYLFRHEDLSREPARVYGRLSEALRISGLPDTSAEARHNRAFSALAIKLFFPGTHRTPTWVGRIEYNSRLHERVIRTARRVRTALIQHVFDRMIYRDWDLLASHGMRARLDACYEVENRVIERVAREILEHGPGDRALELARNAPDSRPGCEAPG